MKALAGQLEAEGRLCVHQVGRAGVSPAVLVSLDKALEANELVKVKAAGPEAGAEFEAGLGCVALTTTGGHWLLYRASERLEGRRRSTEVQLQIRDKHREWKEMKKHRQKKKKRSAQGGSGAGSPAGGAEGGKEGAARPADPPDMVVVKRNV